MRSGFIYKKGGQYRADKNVDGEFHHELMTTKADPATHQPDGLLESARKYFGKKKRPCNPSIQQDQAGGHGVYGESGLRKQKQMHEVVNLSLTSTTSQRERQMVICVIQVYGR